MIKLHELKRTVRECTAPFEYNDPTTGETIIEPIRVKYFAQTIAEIKQKRSDALAKARAAESNPEAADFPWLSLTLFDQIESLPDIQDRGGKPLKITIENLEKIAAINLQAIEKAINEDMVPKALPPK